MDFCSAAAECAVKAIASKAAKAAARPFICTMTVLQYDRARGRARPAGGYVEIATALGNRRSGRLQRARSALCVVPDNMPLRMDRGKRPA
jgi:hypothetical protein